MNPRALGPDGEKSTAIEKGSGLVKPPVLEKGQRYLNSIYALMNNRQYENRHSGYI
ncbi:hypothetical protein JXB12_06750 [candidate division KSB1 bacterium]|nr:hypothetical protein [candidate division KSB1 bacterium]